MIIKKREKPLILQKYEALHRRLRNDFPRFHQVEYEYGKTMKGYTGEVKVDYFIETLAPRYTILQDVCLKVNGQTAQMDNLIITPHAIYIIEVKNYSGTIIFDTILNQFSRDNGTKEIGFSHPITQAEFQQLKLQNWLQNHNFPSIPIHFFIAISAPSTIIKVVGDYESIARTVTHGDNLVKKIIENEQQLVGSTPVPHQKIGHAIKRECVEFDKDIMGDHVVQRKDLVTGVWCTSCGRLGMERRQKNWHCSKCSHRDKRAHFPAINDYRLLINNWTTNRECRAFLEVPSRHTMLRMLKHARIDYDPQRKRWLLKSKVR